MNSDYYLRISKASDLKNRKERIIFRFFEALPALLSWGTIILLVFLSWKAPSLIAVFIIIFVLFWFFRTVYFSLHLRAGYKKMKENEKKDWLKEIIKLAPENYSLPIKNWREIWHLIILPMYREPLVIVRETFLSLEKSDYPKGRMIVFLACEEKVKEEIEETVQIIKNEFENKFFKFFVTWHPANLAGEIAGKGSNETWAAKKAKEFIIDPLHISYQNIIVSSFDIDSCVYPKYFSCLAYNYLTTVNPCKTSFQPIPLYINNIWQAPILSRVFSFSASFWQAMNQERTEKLITFSSHSMSFNALVEAGFKQTDVVSDDSRIFWQCFLRYNGDYRVKPLFYPISMDANAAKSFWRTMANIYKQQRRWAYGVGDIPYFLFGFLKNKKIPISRKISLGFELIEGHWSWAAAPLVVFIFGWLPLLVGGNEFNQTLFSYNLPKIISWIMTFSMVGLIVSCYLSLLLLPPKPPQYGRFKYVLFALGWLLVPVVTIFFSALPSLDAQTRLMLARYMGFWVTEKVRR